MAQQPSLLPRQPLPPRAMAKPDEGGAAPKLRMPSVVDLNLIQPENAPNPALLTPAPPPTIGEAGQGRQRRGRRLVATDRLANPAQPQPTGLGLHTQEHPDLLGQAPRLRPRQTAREASPDPQTVLGVAVAAIPRCRWSCWGSLAERETRTAQRRPGCRDLPATRRWKRVDGGAASLKKLAAKYPQDSRIYRALARQHAARKNYAGALRAVGSLSRLDPVMASDDQMLQVVTEAALQPETSDAASRCWSPAWAIAESAR